MSCVEDDDVMEKLSAKATHHAFSICILPGRGRCRDDFIDTEGRKLSLNPVTIDGISVSYQILRGGIKRKRFHDLLGCPLCRWIFCHIQVDNAPLIMR